MSSPPAPQVSRGSIVRLKRHLTPDEDVRANETARSCVERRGVRTANASCSRRFNGFAARGEIPRECLDELAEARLLEDVEPDIQVSAFATNITDAPWGVERVGLLGEEHLAGVTDPAAETDVDVFVLDTGVDPTHPRLNVVEVKSMLEDENEPEDLNGHGTMCAGIIGSRVSADRPEDVIDMVGVAPGARVHGLKVLDKDGSGYLSDIISGVEEVGRFKEAHPDKRVVANLSLGGYAGSTRYTSLDHELIVAQDENDLIFVVAAGNSADDAALYTPAHAKDVVTVGAFDANDSFSSFSNYGHAVDILAPGSDIVSTAVGGGLTRASGTSFAAPFVAGALARFVAHHGTADTKTLELLAALVKRARKTPAIANVPNGTAPYVLQV